MSRWLMCTPHCPAHRCPGATGQGPEQTRLQDAQAPCWATLGPKHTISFRTLGSGKNTEASRALTQRTKSICTGDNAAKATMENGSPAVSIAQGRKPVIMLRAQPFELDLCFL